MTRDEERGIIDRVLSGHKEEFELLVLEHQKGVYNLALRMAGSEQDALDLSQEAFLKAYSYLSNFRGDSKFSVWLYRLTSNVCIDFLRKKKRGAALSLTMTGDADEGEELEIADSRFEPQNELQKNELKRAVAEGLRELSEDYRRILTLREINGLSYEDIGAALSLEPGTVKSRLFRARRRLADILIRSGNITPAETSNKAEAENGSRKIHRKGGVMDE